ncbi:retrovirus-related pol polyprotein from transposon TNT 1-94 [Tanacetum coccineum]
MNVDEDKYLDDVLNLEAKLKTNENVSMESDLDATWKQNEILNDQLLEATLEHDVEKCVLMCNDFVKDNSLDEIEKIEREILEVQEGLGHNLFSVGQFCNGDLEVAFRSKTCYVRNLEIDDLLTATSTKSWLWHRMLLNLNYDTINDLTKQDLVDGLPKLKYDKDHLCSACERGKSKKATHPPKLIPSTCSKLELIHMDLCGPKRFESINGKKYILVIVDDYSRYTWVYFLQTKDETPKIIKKFIAQVQLNFNVKIQKVRTDNGT